MKPMSTILAILLACLFPLMAQTGIPVPEFVAFDSTIEGILRAYQIPGASLAIAHQGRLIHARGFGLADRDRPEPVQPDSLFRIASLSKTITGIAALKLVEQGKLRLEDRAFGQILSNYVPPPPATKI
ncbi:MAG: serine hydrolase domain-containing protein, partial [Acidobacteriota bacterium]